MGSWKGRGNQYIEFIRVLYCKLPINGKQLPAFPLEASEVGGESVTTLPLWPLYLYEGLFVMGFNVAFYTLQGHIT